VLQMNLAEGWLIVRKNMAFSHRTLMLMEFRVHRPTRGSNSFLILRYDAPCFRSQLGQSHAI
jgi:hypothetical protein